MDQKPSDEKKPFLHYAAPKNPVPPAKRRKNGLILLLVGLVFIAFAVAILILPGSGENVHTKGSPVLGFIIALLVGAFLIWSAIQAFQGKTDLKNEPRHDRPYTPEERQARIEEMGDEERQAFERITGALATPTSASSPTVTRMTYVAKFCAGCGATVDPTKPFCPQCGKPVEKYEEVRTLTSNDAAPQGDRIVGTLATGARDISEALQGNGAPGSGTPS